MIEPMRALGEYVTQRSAELVELEACGEFDHATANARLDELMMTMTWLRDRMQAEVDELRRIVDEDG